MHNFRELEIWKRALSVAEECNKLIKSFPKEERYTLGNQMFRAAISISSNIAEGAGRNSNKAFMQFFGFRKWILLRIGNSIDFSSPVWINPRG